MRNLLIIFVNVLIGVGALAQEYKPSAQWSGRLILPQQDQRDAKGAVLFEVVNSPSSELKSKTLWLEFQPQVPDLKRVNEYTPDIRITKEVAEVAGDRNSKLPQRVNNWSSVSVLESLAGARAEDDVLVKLVGEITVSENQDRIFIDDMPVQISGHQMSFVRFEKQVSDNEFIVRHYNSAKDDFGSGTLEKVWVDHPEESVNPGLSPVRLDGIETHRLNQEGWLAFGDFNAAGVFILKALEPYGMFKLEDDDYIVARGVQKDCRPGPRKRPCSKKWRYSNFLHHKHWRDIESYRNDIRKFKVVPKDFPADMDKELYKEGAEFFVSHIYGASSEHASRPANIFAGHYTFGLGKVVKHPFNGKLVMDITYFQVYGQGPSDIISGMMSWHEFMGHTRRGRMYLRSSSDVFAPIPADFFVSYQNKNNEAVRPMDVLKAEFYLMMAKYRSGFGDGGTIVGLGTSCVSDTSQALFNTVLNLNDQLKGQSGFETLKPELKPLRQSFGSTPWVNLLTGTEIKEEYRKPMQHTLGKITWVATHVKTLFPRIPHDTFMLFQLRHGTPLRVVQSFLIGGDMNGVMPVAPNTLIRRN